MKLEISKQEITDIDPQDFIMSKVKDPYMTKLIEFANKAGLEGKKIKEIVSLRETFGNNLYIDFILIKEGIVNVGGSNDGE